MTPQGSDIGGLSLEVFWLEEIVFAEGYGKMLGKVVDLLSHKIRIHDR